MLEIEKCSNKQQQTNHHTNTHKQTNTQTNNKKHTNKHNKQQIWHYPDTQIRDGHNEKMKLQTNVLNGDRTIIFFSNRMLANQIQEYIKESIHHDQNCFIPEMQGWFIVWKSINVIWYIDWFKERKHVIISIAVENTYDNIQLPSWLKTLKRLWMEQT